jgi:hypothetical protein
MNAGIVNGYMPFCYQERALANIKANMRHFSINTKENHIQWVTIAIPKKDSIVLTIANLRLTHTPQDL